jgi:hypothetical protein
MIIKTPFILLWGLVVLWLLGALIFVVFNVIVVVIAMFTGDSGKVVGVIVVVSVGRNTEVISILFNFFKLCTSIFNAFVNLLRNWLFVTKI